MLLKILTITILSTQHHYAQFTLIPDAEFESHLVSEGIDTDGMVNGQVLTADIEDELHLDVSLRPLLKSMVGIEDFSSLETLIINQVNISQLDISQNANLIYLQLQDMSLESLDLSNNINLRELILALNVPTGMFVSNLSNLDLSNNIDLDELLISYTEINSLDFSSNINLTYINLFNVPLNSVDVSFNLYLDRIELQMMPFLYQVNLKNGNNNNIIFLNMQDNPNLVCLQVDDPVAVIAGTIPPYDSWLIGNNPVISDICFLDVEDNLVKKIIVTPNPAKSFIKVQGYHSLEKVIFFTISGKKLFEVNNELNLINIDHLQIGTYIIEVTSMDGSRSYTKVLKRQ